MNAGHILNSSDEDIRSAVKKRMVQVVVQFVVANAIIFLAAGTLKWPLAWALVAVQLGVLAFNIFILLPNNPELVAERSQVKENTKSWDRILTGIATLGWVWL